MKSLRFGTKLLLTLLPIIVISIGVIAWLSYGISRKTVIEQQSNNMKQLVTKTVQTLSVWIDDRIRDSVVFSRTSVFVDACLGERLEDSAERLRVYHKSAPLYENIFVATPGGKLFQDALGASSAGLDLMQIADYRTNVGKAKNGVTWLSQVSKSPVNGRPVCLVTSPIYADRELVGILGAPVEVNSFSDDFVGSITIGKKGYLFMVDGNGWIVAHPDPEKIMNVNLNDLDFGREMMKMKKGRLEYSDEGQEMIAFFDTDQRQGWMVVAIADQDEFLGATAGIRNYSLITGLAAVLLLGLAVWYQARSITIPLEKTVANLGHIAKGRLSEDVDGAQLARGDEIGDLSRGLQKVLDTQRDLVRVAQAIAGGRLDVKVNLASDQDALGGALKEMAASLYDIIRTNNEAIEQVASGSNQVSESSQALSQGASEQAASLEQITSSMTQLSSQTVTNAENAGQANALANNARLSAETGNEKMNTMIEAMSGINQASAEIAKIIKTIDEIAFQTNLLALNAAVEAARAGTHGKGFAVVAQEVRNLAGRSAKAAQETAELIDGTVKKVQNGTQILDQTGESLSEIVGEITRVTDLVAEIASASNEQAEGIRQVNQGLGQIEKVTQQNTATAEESASAADHLSSQAEDLKKLMRRFKLSREDRETPGDRRVVESRKPKKTANKPIGPWADENVSTGQEAARSAIFIDLDDDV